MTEQQLHSDPNYKITKNVEAQHTSVDIRYSNPALRKNISSISVVYSSGNTPFKIMLYSHDPKTQHEFADIGRHNGAKTDIINSNVAIIDDLKSGTMDAIVSKITAEDFVPPLYKTLLRNHLTQQAPIVSHQP